MLLYCPLLTNTRIKSYKVLRDFVKYHIGDDTYSAKESTAESVSICLTTMTLYSKLRNILETFFINYIIRDYLSTVILGGTA